MMPLFPLGRTVQSRGALDALLEGEAADMLRRHEHGDWGELDGEDKDANLAALRLDERILSRYTSERGFACYVITEHDRSLTTVCLVEEY